jgi:uncharacterized membrane protein YgcG
MSYSTLKSLYSPKLIRNVLLLVGLLLVAVFVQPRRTEAQLDYVYGAGCNETKFDANFPGALCVVVGFCLAEDKAPGASAFAWGQCPNGVTVVNHAKSYGTVGGMAVQAQASNTTIYFAPIGWSSETAFCNGTVNSEHVPSNLTACSIFMPPPGLPPDVCYANYCFSWDPDLFPFPWGSGGGGDGGGGGGGGDGGGGWGGGGGCDYCAGNWWHDASCSGPYDNSQC